METPYHTKVPKDDQNKAENVTSENMSITPNLQQFVCGYITVCFK